MATAALIIVTAACTGGDATTQPPISTEDVTTSSSTTTTKATTTAPPTTEPTSTTLDDETAVRDLHTRYMTEFAAFTGKDVTAQERIDLLRTMAIDPLLQRTIEVRTEDEAMGYYSLGDGYDSNIVSVQVDGDSASVLDCSKDLGELYDSNDELLVAADDYFKLRQSEMVKIDGQWWITDVFTGGDNRCDPDDI